MKKLLVTGSSGLIGSEAVAFFSTRGWASYGVDNNIRRDFFGPDGDTTWNLERLRKAEELQWGVFCKDMQAVLLAELDVRMQPVEGLLEALRTTHHE